MLPAMILIFGGGIAVWTGFVDPPGGLIEAAKNVIAGRPVGSTAENPGKAGKRMEVKRAIYSLYGTAGPTTEAVPTSDTSDASGDSGSAVVAYAKTFLGVPYKWGGRTRAGFDCAGLVHFVAAHFGYNTAWYVGGQLADTKTFARVSKADRRPGDIVFHGVHHVSIYLGNNTVIHAPHAGTVVRIEGNMGNTPGPYVYGRLRLERIPAKAKSPGSVAT